MSASVAICKYCGKKPCVPKLRGQGLGKACEICREGINTRSQRTRDLKKDRKADQDRQNLRQELEEDKIDSWFRHLTEDIQDISAQLKDMQTQLKDIQRRL